MSALSSDVRGIHIPCPACGQVNRLLFARLGQTIRCGRCQASLSESGAPASPVAVTDDEVFAALVSQSPFPVLVDFWAGWCGPCRSVAPEVDALARSTAGQLLVVKIDTEAAPSLAQAFQIASLPTFVVVERGREVRRQSGAMPAAALRRLALGRSG